MTVNFSATAYDPDGGSIVQYRWDFGDGAADTTVVPSTMHTYHTPNPSWWATVTVTDDDGETNSDMVPIDVWVAGGWGSPPEGFVGVVPPSGPPGTPFTFTVVAWDPDGGDIVQYQWRFGDGTVDTTSGADPTGNQNTHIYTSPGTYMMDVILVDDEGMQNVTPPLYIDVYYGGPGGGPGT